MLAHAGMDPKPKSFVAAFTKSLLGNPPNPVSQTNA
jgi:hypothetical protein